METITETIQENAANENDTHRKAGTRLTLGMRNNNPLNIRDSQANRWIGTDTTMPQRAGFVHFTSMEYGLRAALVIMRRYVYVHGADTLRKVITRWAPPCENDVKAYVAYVCKRTGMAPDTLLVETWQTDALVAAMARYESGCLITTAEVRAVRMKYRV